MKKIFFLTLCFSLAVSCDSFLKVNFADQPELEDVLSHNKTSRDFLAHLYNYMPLEEDMVGGSGWVVGRSSQALYSWYSLGSYQFYRADSFAATSATESEYDQWDYLYEGIRQATTFILNIDRDVQDNEATRILMKAEARFIRAYCYYALLRQYGPVVILGDGLYDENTVNAEVDRNTLDENVDWIVSELDKASIDLPMSMADCGEGNIDWRGRATKGAALALKARILTMAASPLYNGCEIYKGQMKNIKGKYLFPQAADQTKWERASAACKAVIDLGLYSLCTSEGGDAFKAAAEGYQKVFFENWNDETIWGWWKRTYNNKGKIIYENLGGTGMTIAMEVPEGFGKYSFSGICPSLALVDSYAMYVSGRYPVTGYENDCDGLDYSKPKVDALSGYVADGWTEGYHQPVDADWAPAIKAHNSTIGREPRFYAAVVPNGFYWPNQNLDDARFLVGVRPTSQHCRVGYAWRRNYPAGMILASQSDYSILKAVYPDIRLAEIYLSYAEALNEQPSRDEAAAINYLDKVRCRAGLKPIEIAYPEVAGNKELLRALIQHERKVEFAMEPLSWYDSLRWMTAGEECNAGNWTLKCSADSYEGSYERVKNEFAAPPARFTDRDYLFPIPFSVLTKTVNMTQNYGY